MSAALESVRYFYNQGVKVGTVTGASRAGVKATSQSHGFEKQISVVFSGDDLKNSQPAADCYLLAAYKLGLKASQCTAIEDTQAVSLQHLQPT